MTVPLDAAQFRAAMGSLANGVTVITTRNGEGRGMGMTVTAISSLSLDPPLLLACIGHEAVLHDLIVRGAKFGVIMLADSQRDLADHFATRGRQSFAPDAPRSPAGLPTVPGAIATIDCRLKGVLEGGDHSIVVGELEWVDVREGAPLVHWRGDYTRLAP